MAYAGYRGAETPRTLIVRGQSIQVTAVLARWVEGSRTERGLRRFFRVAGDDRLEHTVFVNEEGGHWHEMADQTEICQNIDRGRPA